VEWSRRPHWSTHHRCGPSPSTRRFRADDAQREDLGGMSDPAPACHLGAPAAFARRGRRSRPELIVDRCGATPPQRHRRDFRHPVSRESARRTSPFVISRIIRVVPRTDVRRCSRKASLTFPGSSPASGSHRTHFREPSFEHASETLEHRRVRLRFRPCIHHEGRTARVMRTDRSRVLK
jgi:hypothetical protein